YMVRRSIHTRQFIIRIPPAQQWLPARFLGALVLRWALPGAVDGVGVWDGDTTTSTSTLITPSTAMPTSAAIGAQSVAIGIRGSTTRSIGEALLTETALRLTGLVPMPEAIHWPAVREPLNSRSAGKRGILEVWLVGPEALVVPAALVASVASAVLVAQ